MSTGRSLEVFKRIYIGGYDLSAYFSDSGEQGTEYEEHPTANFADAIQGVLAGKPTLKCGPFTGVFDNTATSGLHVLADAAKGTRRNVMVAQGVRAAPAMGDDVFCAPVYQMGYKTVGAGIVTARLEFSGADAAGSMLYDNFWGKLIHAHESAGAANSANTNVDNGAESTAGGYLMYQIQSIAGGAGTVTLSIDDSANGTDWLALDGATTGAIAYSDAPTSGIVQLAVGATVRQYLRWQYAESGATSAVFSLAFVRGR